MEVGDAQTPVSLDQHFLKLHQKRQEWRSLKKPTGENKKQNKKTNNLSKWKTQKDTHKEHGCHWASSSPKGSKPKMPFLDFHGEKRKNQHPCCGCLTLKGDPSQREVQRAKSTGCNWETVMFRSTPNIQWFGLVVWRGCPLTI